MANFSSFSMFLFKNLCLLSLVMCGVIVQGRHLQRGCRLVDFEIKLGDSECVPVSLTDNQVDSRPPTDKPNNNLNDTFCHGDALSLQVSETVRMLNINETLF